MKTILSLAVLATLALTSCKKNYTCDCITTKEYDGNFEEGVVYDFYYEPTSSSRTIKEKKKADAKTSCESGTNVSYETGYYESQGQQPTVVTTSCQIQ